MKKIICIFEGMSYDMLQSCIEQKLLPSFENLCKYGRSGQLVCNPIPYEASGLMTAFSGLSSYEHGIISYWNPRSKGYIPQEWKSDDVKNCMFWNQQSCRDIRYLLVNLFGTQPVYPINGCMLSYSMEKNLQYSYPKTLLLDLHKAKLPYVQDTCAFFTPDTDKKKFCKDVLHIDRMRKDVFLYLCEKERYDVSIVNFTAIDRLSHFCMDEIERKPVQETLLFQAYKQCDDFLQELQGRVDTEGSELIVFSEIGFGSLRKFVRINDYLQEKGLLKYDSDSGKVLYDQSIAFESVQGSHGVNINQCGYFDSGIVGDDEYPKVLQQVLDVLKSMPNPYNGAPMFSDVEISSLRYQSSRLPDLLMEPYNWEYLPYGDPYWANHVSRNYQTGWHGKESFWGYSGEDPVKNGQKTLLDIYNMIQKDLEN